MTAWLVAAGIIVQLVTVFLPIPGGSRYLVWMAGEIALGVACLFTTEPVVVSVVGFGPAAYYGYMAVQARQRHRAEAEAGAVPPPPPVPIRAPRPRHHHLPWQERNSA